MEIIDKENLMVITQHVKQMMEQTHIIYHQDMEWMKIPVGLHLLNSTLLLQAVQINPTTFCVFYEDGNKTEFDGKLNVLGDGSNDYPLVAGCQTITPFNASSIVFKQSPVDEGKLSPPLWDKTFTVADSFNFSKIKAY